MSSKITQSPFSVILLFYFYSCGTCTIYRIFSALLSACVVSSTSNPCLVFLTEARIPLLSMYCAQNCSRNLLLLFALATPCLVLSSCILPTLQIPTGNVLQFSLLSSPEPAGDDESTFCVCLHVVLPRDVCYHLSLDYKFISWKKNHG